MLTRDETINYMTNINEASHDASNDYAKSMFFEQPNKNSIRSFHLQLFDFFSRLLTSVNWCEIDDSNERIQIFLF